MTIIPTLDTARNNDEPHKSKSIIPESVAQYLGAPLVLLGEDLADYERMFEEVALAISPKNFIEWLWVKDVTDFTWDMRRFQRLKVAAIDLGRKHALDKIMRRIIDNKRKDFPEQVHRLTHQWFVDPKVKEEVQKLLQIMGLSEECISAQAFFDNSAKIFACDTLLGNANSRRNNALKEIERNRASLLAPQKQADVIDVEPGNMRKSSAADATLPPQAGDVH